MGFTKAYRHCICHVYTKEHAHIISTCVSNRIPYNHVASPTAFLTIMLCLPPPSLQSCCVSNRLPYNHVVSPTAFLTIMLCLQPPSLQSCCVSNRLSYKHVVSPTAFLTISFTWSHAYNSIQFNVYCIYSIRDLYTTLLALYTVMPFVEYIYPWTVWYFSFFEDI